MTEPIIEKHRLVSPAKTICGATLCLVLISSGPALADTTPPRVIVDIYAPRAAIRAQLLQETPTGSSIEHVVRFISKRLQNTRSGEAKITVEPDNIPSHPRVAETIHAYLGQYYKHLGAVFLTAPMVVHEDISARWLFDRHRRLIDIVVDKQTGVY
jgi:hypothetical protein